jgi:hypothetical protein
MVSWLAGKYGIQITFFFPIEFLMLSSNLQIEMDLQDEYNTTI